MLDAVDAVIVVGQVWQTTTGSSRPRDPSAALLPFGHHCSPSAFLFLLRVLLSYPLPLVLPAQRRDVTTADISNKPFPWGMQSLFFNPEFNVPAAEE